MEYNVNEDKTKQQPERKNTSPTHQSNYLTLILGIGLFSLLILFLFQSKPITFKYNYPEEPEKPKYTYQQLSKLN